MAHTITNRTIKFSNRYRFINLIDYALRLQSKLQWALYISHTNNIFSMALIALYIYVCALSHVKCYSFVVDVYTHEMTMFSFFGIAFVVFCLVLSCFHTFSVRLILFSASSGDFNQMLDMSVRESVLVLIYARSADYH